jgi:hypothetical protein
MDWKELVRRKFLYAFGSNCSKEVGEDYVKLSNTTSSLSAKEVSGTYEIELKRLDKTLGCWVNKTLEESNVAELTSTIASGLEDSRGWCEVNE